MCVTIKNDGKPDDDALPLPESTGDPAKAEAEHVSKTLHESKDNWAAAVRKINGETDEG